jgi:hypothetical protein
MRTALHAIMPMTSVLNKNGSVAVWVRIARKRRSLLVFDTILAFF